MNIKLLLKKTLKTCFAILIFFGGHLGNDIIAQKTTAIVSGVIVDETGMPLPGVNVLEKGTKNGTSTDFDGKYSFTVSTSSATLVISYVGFATQEILISGKSEVNITLKAELESLNEVVVVGYGKVKKSDVTGSVSSIGGETITERKVINPVEGLQGSVPGVVITQKQGV